MAKPFLNQDAPAGYVPGIGRGATGFTTRSDIGPARDSMDVPDERHWKHLKKKEDEKGDDDGENLNDSNYDEFNGYGGSLFKDSAYDQDDAEADAIYDYIDNRQDERRKDHRERKEVQELEKFRKERPKIQQQFSDLKRELASVSVEEWENLPEVTDIGKKVKKQRREKFTPAPDSLLHSAMAGKAQVTSLDSRQQKYGGLQTPAPGTQTLMPGFTGDLDLGEIGRARTSMIEVKLDQASDSITGQTVVDPKGYLTDLSSLTPQSAGDIGDVKKGRMLLASVRKTNPKHAPGWIASARLEETTGKIQSARNLIVRGTELCPSSEDVWLEAARLLPPDQARAAIAQGVQHIPTSVRMWMKATDLETDVKAKKRVLRRALEAIPDSVRLWKAAVDLESPEDAKLLLGRAVECCSSSVELWLALAHLETYDNAKTVLNRARKAVPTDRSIWVAAAQLEEAADHVDRVVKIIETGVRSLQANMVEINRTFWMEDAERCDKAGSPFTAQAIVHTIVAMGVEEEDRRDTWLHDAEAFVEHGAFNCARAIYAHALSLFRKDEDIWLRAAFFEREHGTAQSLDEHLARAVELCPHAETLWLMRAKAQWVAGDVNRARQVLTDAFTANPNSEDIWLAAVKLESESNQDERARKLLENARRQAGTARVWIKSARLEWVLGRLQDAEQLVMDALKLHGSEAKLWLMAGQIAEQMGDDKKAEQAYNDGTKHCPTSVPLWIYAANLQTKKKNFIAARAILERGRLRNKQRPELWLAAVRTETAAGLDTAAKSLMATAIQDCPTSGLLWSESIFMETKPQRKTKSVDALKKCENDPLVLLAVARLFLSERKTSKARSWFTRTVKLDADLGDAWASYYKFELQYGTEAQQEDVLKHCVTAEPHHGEVWQRVAKDPKNWRMGTKEILIEAARQVPSY